MPETLETKLYNLEKKKQQIDIAKQIDIIKSIKQTTQLYQAREIMIEITALYEEKSYENSRDKEALELSSKSSKFLEHLSTLDNIDIEISDNYNEAINSYKEINNLANDEKYHTLEEKKILEWRSDLPNIKTTRQIWQETIQALPNNEKTFSGEGTLDEYPDPGKHHLQPELHSPDIEGPISNLTEKEILIDFSLASDQPFKYTLNTRTDQEIDDSPAKLDQQTETPKFQIQTMETQQSQYSSSRTSDSSLFPEKAPEAMREIQSIENAIERAIDSTFENIKSALEALPKHTFNQATASSERLYKAAEKQYAKNQIDYYRQDTDAKTKLYSSIHELQAIYVHKAKLKEKLLKISIREIYINFEKTGSNDKNIKEIFNTIEQKIQSHLGPKYQQEKQLIQIEQEKQQRKAQIEQEKQLIQIEQERQQRKAQIEQEKQERQQRKAQIEQEKYIRKTQAVQNNKKQ